MKKIIVISHGIRNGRKGWTKQYIAWAKQFLKDKGLNPDDYLFVDASYGFIPAALLAIPLTAAMARWSYIKRIQRLLWDLQHHFPAVEICCILHSWSTMLFYEAIRHSDNDTDMPAIKVGTIVMWGGIVSNAEDFKDTLGAGKIKRIINYYSNNDVVVKHQPIYGKSGWTGFLNEYEGVRNIQTPARHNEYTSEERFWIEALQVVI